MKDLAAAEHTIHAKLALDGHRTIYPKTAHNVMFLQTSEVCSQVDEILAAIRRKNASNQV